MTSGSAEAVAEEAGPLESGPVHAGAMESGPLEAGPLEAGAGGGSRRPIAYTPRRDCGLSMFERVLYRAGLSPVAGVDEAGRGACAGPLVVAAVILRPSRISRLTELADSKALTAKARNSAYSQIMDAALAWHVVTIPAADIDRLGLHVCNVAGMRRALAGLTDKPGYILTDGFPVRGLTTPALAMWKGDQVAACVAAASIVAKVTRDALMSELDGRFPGYGFARHKGYSTPSHMRALAEQGACPEHRQSFVNVRGRTLAEVELVCEQPGPDSLVISDTSLADDGGFELVIPDNSRAGDSCYPPGSGQNGPIVDVIDEHGWPTAGLAAMARDA
jgi:ribonuclease HII